MGNSYLINTTGALVTENAGRDTYNKAKDFLRSRYDEDHVAKFEELLDIRYGLDIDAEEEEREIPLAVGATAAAGGGI